MNLKNIVEKTICEYFNENQFEKIKDNTVSTFNNKIEGRFLNKKQAYDLQREIEANYINGDINQQFNQGNDDIRMNMFNYDTPIAQKNVNNIDLRIVSGLIRNNRQTYLLYADGDIIGEFYSVNDIKTIINYIEDNLIKSSPNNPNILTGKQ